MRDVDRQRLALLVPEMAATRCDRQTYALAYVDRYQGDILQLAQEWEFLYDALTEAWQRAEYGVVVRLVTALAYTVGRIPSRVIAESILQWGISAARHTGDRQQLAGFVNRLSGVQYAHGQYRVGRQTWRSSLELAAGEGAVPLWEPLATFAYTADVLGGYPAAQQFATAMQAGRRQDDAEGWAVALFIRGFYARVNNDPAAAYSDVGDCLRLLAQQASGTAPAPYRQLFTSVVQAELARVQGDYARSQSYTATALALTQLFGDHHTTMDLLVDQALFSAQQERFADLQPLLQRLAEAAHAGTHFHTRYRIVQQRLAAYLPMRERHIAAGPPPTEPLSTRETEVLQLIAAGHANNAIAVQLVVTPGTVKKHLEHIYSKLNVHSRTAAVARARKLDLF